MTERKLKVIVDQTGDASGNISKMVAAIGGIALLTKGFEALGGAMIDSVGKASKLSAQMSTIGARSGATADEVSELKDLVSNLALDPDLKVSAFEAAAAIEELAAGGVAIEDIMEGAAEGTVALANAVGGDFAQSAEVAASTMSVFGVEAENMTEVVDGVTAVVVASKFDLNDYALALAQAGGAASTSGVELEDFNTAIAAIAPLFASGSDAGTSFKTMLQRLVPDTKPAKEAMLELGILTEDGGNKFFDAAGNLRSMAEISGILDTALSGLSEEQRNSALQTIFGTDAMRAAVGLMKEGEAGFNALQATMSQTSGSEAAAMMMDNLAGDTEILQGVVEGLQISYGDKLIPKLRELSQASTEYLTENGPAMADSFAGLTTESIDLAASLGGLGVTLSNIGGEAGPLSGKIDSITSAIDRVNSAVEIADGLWTNLTTILSAEGTGSVAVEALQAVKRAASSMLNPIQAAIDAWNRLMDAFQSAQNAIPDVLFPHSPTPFQVGLEGIAGAADKVSRAAPAAFAGFAGPSLAAAGAGGGIGGGTVIQFTYAPLISTADKAEAEQVLRPILEQVIRDYNTRKGIRKA